MSNNKRYTYIRKTADADNPDISTSQVIGETDSKHVASEVDELVRRRLNSKIKSSTNSKPVIVIASTNPDFEVGQKFDSGRAACRALDTSAQNLSLAFCRGTVDADGCRTGTVKDVTFKQISKCSSI